MASLTRKARSRFWFACFRDDKGRQRRRSTKETNYAKALKIAERFEEVSQKRLSVRAVREAIISLARESYGDVVPIATTRKYFSDWLKIKALEVEDGTVVLYTKAVDKFINFLGDRADLEISMVSRMDVVEFRNWVAAKVSAGTANGDLRTVKQILRSARLEGYIVEDPSELVKPVPGEKEGRKRAFTVDELRRVLAVADDEWRSLVLFGLYTGQRLGDMVSLTWDKIDLARNEIRLRTDKTGKPLTIPIAAALRAHIDSLPVNDETRCAIHPRAYAIKQEKGKLAAVSNAFADLLVSVDLRTKSDT